MALAPLNNAVASLRNPIGSANTVLSLQVGTGAKFNIPNGDHVYLTLFDGVSFEVVRYDSTGPIVGDNIPVTRAQDGTTAHAFPNGTCVAVRWNVAQFFEYVQQIASGLIPPTGLSPVYFDTGNLPCLASRQGWRL